MALPEAGQRVDMSNNNFGGLNNSLNNIRLLSGTRIVAGFSRRPYASGGLGTSQFGWTFVDPSANSGKKGNILPMGGNALLWADDGRPSQGTPEGWPAVWYNTDGWSPTDANIWSRSTRISIPFGANLFSIVTQTGPSMNFGQRMVHDGGSKVYGSLTLFSTAGVGGWSNGWAFAVKDAGPGQWTRLYQNTSFDLYPLALFLPKPTWLAGMRHYATLPGTQNTIVGTQDGGASWLDKTGNLAALRAADGLDMDFGGAPKFAGVFSMY